MKKTGKHLSDYERHKALFEMQDEDIDYCLTLGGLKP